MIWHTGGATFAFTASQNPPKKTRVQQNFMPGDECEMHAARLGISQCRAIWNDILRVGQLVLRAPEIEDGAAADSAQTRGCKEKYGGMYASVSTISQCRPVMQSAVNRAASNSRLHGDMTIMFPCRVPCFIMK